MRSSFFSLKQARDIAEQIVSIGCAPHSFHSNAVVSISEFSYVSIGCAPHSFHSLKRVVKLVGFYRTVDHVSSYAVLLFSVSFYIASQSTELD